MFHLLDIEPQMILDEESIDKAGVCQIINDQKIKMIQGPDGHSDANNSSDWGSSAKLQYGISVNPKECPDIKPISWKVEITSTCNYPNSYYFIGVVSNRATNFKANPCNWNAWSRLIDSYGILGFHGAIYRTTKAQYYINIPNDSTCCGWMKNSWVIEIYH